MLWILTACPFICDSCTLPWPLCFTAPPFLPSSISALSQRSRHTFLCIFPRTSSPYSTLIHLARCISTTLPFSYFHLCVLLLAVSTFAKSPLPICSLSLALPGASLPSPPSTHNQFCPRFNKMKSHLPNVPKVCLALGRLPLLLLSFSFLSFFILIINRLTMLSLHFFHHLLFLCLTFFFLFLSLLPLLVRPLFLISPLFHRVFNNTWVFSLTVFFKSSWVLPLAVFTSFYPCSPALLPSSRACVPFLGVLGFPPPPLPPFAS